MASTDPDRDRNPSVPQDDKTGNPFIKFKRFADAQISSVLQTIIGLPSVFSKGPNDAYLRWKDPDSDTRRLNGLQERRPSIESESKTIGGAEDEEVEIPVKKFPGWSQPAFSLSEPRKSHIRMDDVERDLIDLYSPVTKSLFAHLNRKPEDDVDWNIRRPTTGVAWDLFGVCMPGNIFKLRDDQKIGNALDMIQSMVYNTLNRTASRAECRYFHSDRSLLPYLLFSPYSPLALSSMPPPRKPSPNFQPEVDDFPYCEAFEDLLLASQGREMSQWVLMPSEFTSRTPNSELRKAQGGISWIHGLHTFGLLSAEPMSARSIFGHDPSSLPTPLHMRFMTKNLGPEDFVAAQSTSEDEPETELDMYSRFLQTASPPPNSVTREIESLVNTAERFVRQQLECFDLQNKSPSSERKQAKVTAKTLDDFDLNEFFRGGSAGNISRATQTENDNKNADYCWAEENPTRSATSPSTDRVVSTTTSTQQTMEDGMVRTTIIIEKVFADGRTSITETTNTHLPSSHPDDSSRIGSWRGEDEEGWQGQKPREFEKNESKDNRQGKSKGWFWN